jgi:hypothetical protein
MRLLLLSFLGLPLLLSAQMQVGWRTDTYAGINSALLNPANPARTPYGWDLNLAEGSQFLANNYAYLKQTNAMALLRQRNNDLTFYFQQDIPADLPAEKGAFVYDFLDNNPYFGQSVTSVLGPSLSVRLAPRTRVGVFTRWQAVAGARKIDADLGYYPWQALPDEQPFTLNKMAAAAATWTEVGLNLSQGFETATGELTLGLSVRRLWGERGGYLFNEQPFSLSKLPAAVGLEGNDFAIEAAFTNNATSEDPFAATPGRGWCIDLGLLYQLDLGDGYYRWEFGAALLDVGGLRFTDSQRHLFNANSLTTTLTDNYNNFDPDLGFTELAEQFSTDVFGSSSASRVGDEFRLRLPTKVSLQATYAFNAWAKVEANALVNVAPLGASLTSFTLLALTPRIDRHWWSVALPLSFYAGQQLRLGLAGRLGPVFLGTDQLGSFFGKKNLTGADFYLGLKFFPWNIGSGKQGKSKSKGRRSGGKDVECYKF